MGARAFIRRHQVVAYFGLAYALSVVAALAIYGPRLASGAPIRAMTALTMFPVMVIGVGLAGFGLTALVDGRAGARGLLGRIARGGVGAGWYAAALLIPPALILAVLAAFRAVVSPAFAPKVFAFGVMFGVLAGFFEEIGWTGYAFPRLQAGRSPLAAAVLLGLLWGLWHLPVVDFLGAASPHGTAWLPFVLAFIALVTAIRVLICWLSRNTGSLLVAQLLHASSTGFLVVLSPVGVSPAQEALWYAVYAVALWVVVGLVVARYGASLAPPSAARPPAGAPASIRRGWATPRSSERSQS